MFWASSRSCVADATKQWLLRNCAATVLENALAGRAARFSAAPTRSFRSSPSVLCSSSDGTRGTPGGDCDPIEQPPNPRCMKVAVIGMPNAGKSTLINRLVGSQVSAVSPKVQTTRERILAVLSEGIHCNFIYIALPTLTAPKTSLPLPAVGRWRVFHGTVGTCNTLDTFHL